MILIYKKNQLNHKLKRRSEDLELVWISILMKEHQKQIKK